MVDQIILKVSDRSDHHQERSKGPFRYRQHQDDREIRALPACCLMMEIANTREIPVDNNKEMEKTERV